MSSSPGGEHASLGELAEICESRSCEDLMSGDISVHSIQPDILRESRLEICHEIDQSHIIIGSEISRSPDLLELRVRSDDHRIDLHLVRTKI